MFEQIANDPYIIALYEQVQDYEELNHMWSDHSDIHIKNVINTVEEILSGLNYNQEFIDSAKIAALLHDIGYVKGEDGHAIHSYELAKEYFEKKRINLKYQDLILDAIKNHGSGFDSNNIMTLVLILADKIDLKYNRLTKYGIDIDGLKETQYINDIKVDINNENFIVNFIADKKINVQALTNFYFIPKVFNAIAGFAKKMNLNYLVMINNEEWSLNI